MQWEDFYEEFAGKRLEEVSEGSLESTMNEFHWCPRGKQ
jgi:hypothetical protein